MFLSSTLEATLSILRSHLQTDTFFLFRLFESSYFEVHLWWVCFGSIWFSEVSFWFDLSGLISFRTTSVFWFPATRSKPPSLCCGLHDKLAFFYWCAFFSLTAFCAQQSQDDSSPVWTDWQLFAQREYANMVASEPGGDLE